MVTCQTTDATRPPFISPTYVKSEIVKLKSAKESTGVYSPGQVPVGHLPCQAPQSQAAAGLGTLSQEPLDYKDPQGGTIPKYSNNSYKKNPIKPI